MAFMGRGGFSNFGGNNVTTDGLEHEERRYYRGGLIRLHYYVPLNNTYVIFQMLVTFLIMISLGISFVFKYKSTIIDPIEDLKKTVLIAHAVIIVILLGITFITNYYSKNKNYLIKRLFVILIISILALITFLGIKLHLNSIYTASKFEQIYNDEYITENADKKTKMDISITNIQLKTEREYFVDECVKLYNIFNIKTYGIIILNVLLVALLIYQVLKISGMQDKKDRLEKDDAVLFDEEEDVKI